jgi:anti-sigma factor ChrR (cupin superfamily)
MSAPNLSLRLDLAAIPWRATRHPGITWHPFEVPGLPAESSQDAVALIRMEPGCGYPPNRHEGIEDVLILEGSYRDELGLHVAGTFVRYAAGSEHAPIAVGDRDAEGSTNHPACVLFAVARGGVHNR